MQNPHNIYTSNTSKSIEKIDITITTSAIIIMIMIELPYVDINF